jgi:lipopolysaccharide transport system permease protein
MIPISQSSLILSLWRNRGLTAQMVRREVIGRYRGSFLGLAWSFFNPLIMLLIYTFVFTFIFRARTGLSSPGGLVDFAPFLFVGLLMHSLLAECITRAPTLITSNPNYVTKVVFPLEVLGLVAVGSATFHLCVGFVVLEAFLLLSGSGLPATSLLFPLVVFPLLLLATGLVWFLAAIGVYVRDVVQVTGLVATALLFLSPVFYPITAVPEQFARWYYLNPLTYPIEASRALLLTGQPISIGAWLIYFLLSLIVLVAGSWWFQKTRRGFADVL